MIELKNLENEIVGYQDELNKLDAYTLFYNPVKDKMVTHGKPLSEIPGLGNLLNQVKKGTKRNEIDGQIIDQFLELFQRSLNNNVQKIRGYDYTVEELRFGKIKKAWFRLHLVGWLRRVLHGKGYSKNWRLCCVK